MRNILTPFSTRLTRSAALLVLLLLPLLGWGQVTTIFNAAGGGTLPTGWTSVNGGLEPIIKNDYYLVEAGTADVITTASYDLSAYTSATFSVEVATFGNGTNRPAKIEISYNGGTSYTQTGTTETPTGSSSYISSTIPLTGPLTAASVKIRISHSSATGRGVRLKDIKLVANGTATTTPTITLSPAALTPFTTTEGVASAAQTYTVSGSNLNGTTGITVTPPAGYEIGQGATPAYSTSSITVAQTSPGTVAATTISVRLTDATTAAGSPYNGDITHTSTNATDVSKAVVGTVSAVVAGPRITLVQNEGGATASTDVPQNGSYAFPTTTSGASTVQTFYIKNEGAAPLTLTGPTPVTLSSSTAFTITQQPSATSVAAGDSTSFRVSFAPTNSTPASATISVASNDTPRSPYAFTVTGRTSQPFNALRWDGGANTSNWNDANNWVGDKVPTKDSDVLLDHKFVAGTYTVTLNKSSQTTVSSLSIKPGAGLAIEMVIPSANTAAIPIQFTNSAVGDTALAIYSGGLLRNQSGASAGGAGIDAQGVNPTVYILNGGTYRHETVRSHKNLVDNLAATADTRTGTFVFAIPASGGSTIAASDAYGNLTLSSNSSYTYDLGGASTVRGTLTVDNKAGLTTDNNLTVGGNLVLNGVTRLNATVARTLLLNGTTAQTISGRPLGGVSTTTSNLSASVTLKVDNAAGIILNTPVRVNGTLALTNGLITTSTTNLLTLVKNATGGSSTSYVNGPLARVTGTGAASSVFPIGKDGAYRPITLTAASQAAATTYTAEQFNASGGNSLDGGNGKGTAPLNRVSRKHYYTVTSSDTTANNFTGTITLSFGNEAGQEDYVNTPGDPDLVIAKRDNGGAWTNLGRSASTGTGPGPGGVSGAGTLTSASFSGFSDFTLGAQNVNTSSPLAATNPLPVQLTAFTAQRQPNGSGVSLKWATATERNSARFEVQRSVDSRTFGTVATVAAAGGSSQPTTYATLDKAAPATTLYYRLRQVDRDGSFAYSPVATVAGSGGAGKVLLTPNPARRAISFIAAEATPYRVLNQVGQALLSGTTEAGTASIGIEQLPVGLYFLELQTAAGRTVQKFEKE